MKFIWIILIFLVISCIEKANFSIEDFNKHPEIKVFLIDTIELSAIHYFDPAWLHFSYKLSMIVPEGEIINKIDSISISNNWEVVKISNSERKYLKLIKSYPADTETDTLYFNYNSNDNRLNFKWH